MEGGVKLVFGGLSAGTKEHMHHQIMVSRLRADGAIAHAIIPPNNNRCSDAIAKPYIREQILQHYEEYGSLIGIGHSRGGLQLHDAIADPEIGECFEEVLYLGVPWRGAPIAYLGTFKEELEDACKDLLPNSEYVARVASHKPEVRMLNIYSVADVTVPFWSARAPFLESEKNIMLYTVPHDHLLSSPLAYAQIRREIFGDQQTSFSKKAASEDAVA